MSLYSDTSLWVALADKYAVRKYVEEKCGKELLNELYGVYQSPNDIDYSNLPASFILKTTNGCANNILVEDKSRLNINNANKLLCKWLKFPYGEISGQLHYSKIKPQIIAEKLLKQDASSNAPLIDYKFYCFNGEPIYLYVISERIFNTHEYKRMTYDMNWNAHPEFFIKNTPLKYMDKPASFEKMIEYAKCLSQPFPFVRVDFYEIEGQPVFGEMTFALGADTGYTKETQKNLGDLIKMPLLNK
jgi:hypothetical protein